MIWAEQKVKDQNEFKDDYFLSLSMLGIDKLTMWIKLLF